MTSENDALVKRLASYGVETKWSALPGEVVERARMCLLDWIGSAYMGKGSPTDRMAEQFVLQLGRRGVATLIGCGFSASPMEAALYNGMISAVAEIDDVHEEASLHGGIGVIPAALAVGEWVGASGRDVLLSIVVGYDISVRMARAAGSSHYHFWHTSGTCNTFGAAVAAGKLLGLDQEQMGMALGLAGTQAAGLWEGLNAKATTAKHLHSGKAASNGILSAFLAKQGFQGAEKILEGEKGFFMATARPTPEDLQRIKEDWGKPFLIMRNFFKRHACCRACFEGIEGLRTFMDEQRLRAEDLEEIRVTMKPGRTWLVANLDPSDIYEAKFSLPFCMALIAIRGEAGVSAFRQEHLQEPAIRELMGRVKLASDPAIGVKARLDVVLKDGSRWVVEPQCRSLTHEEVVEKFLQNISPLLGRKVAENLVKAVGQVDQMETIKELTRLLKRRLRGG